MRKTILTALVVLLVMLAVVSCDIGSVAGKPEYTEDGRPLVTLKVSVGSGSRALTDALAKSAANYMEVIFKSGGKYYRKDGFLNGTLSLKIPADSYTKDNAILLIGRKSDNTLLATGTTTKVVAATDNGTTITFSIVSLTADLSASAGSTFAIIETSGDDGTDPPNLVPIEETAGGVFKDNTSSGTFKIDDSTPCFQVPTDMAGIKATLTIDGLTNTGANIIVADGSKVKPTAVTPVVFTKVEGDDPISILQTAVTPTIGTSVTAAGKIGITFTTIGEGCYIITFKIPVVGFAIYDDPTIPTAHPTTTPGLEKALTWFIRGGSEDGYQKDTGEYADDGVPLIVTTSPYTLVPIKVGPITNDW